MDSFQSSMSFMFLENTLARALNELWEENVKAGHSFKPWILDHMTDSVSLECTFCHGGLRMARKFYQSYVENSDGFNTFVALLKVKLKNIGPCGSELSPSDFSIKNLEEKDDQLETWLELSEHDEMRISEWLNDPTQWKNSCIYIAKMRHPDSIISEVEINFDLYFRQIKIVRHRLQVNDRWWIEIATREDTGEPIVTVNHPGDFNEYRTLHLEQENKG